MRVTDNDVILVIDGQVAINLIVLAAGVIDRILIRTGGDGLVVARSNVFVQVLEIFLMEEPASIETAEQWSPPVD